MRRALIGLVLLGLAAAGLRTTSAAPPDGAPIPPEGAVVRPGFWSYATKDRLAVLAVTSEAEATAFARTQGTKVHSAPILELMAEDLFGMQWGIAERFSLEVRRQVNDETDGALYKLMRAWLQGGVDEGIMTADEASAWLATERQALLDLGATPANLIPEGV